LRTRRIPFLTATIPYTPFSRTYFSSQTEFNYDLTMENQGNLALFPRPLATLKAKRPGRTGRAF